MTFEIDISSQQNILPVNIHELRSALIHALRAEQVAAAVLSISIVDNPAIHRLNRDHLQHDYPTDVISFALELSAPDDADDEHDDGREHSDTAAGLPLRAAGATIEGEIVASAEMARDMAAEGQWTAHAELTLYLVHGLLHLCGYDDLTPVEQSLMRQRERTIMAGLGLTAVYAEDDTP